MTTAILLNALVLENINIIRVFCILLYTNDDEKLKQKEYIRLQNS